MSLNEGVTTKEGRRKGKGAKEGEKVRQEEEEENPERKERNTFQLILVQACWDTGPAQPRGCRNPRPQPSHQLCPGLLSKARSRACSLGHPSPAALWCLLLMASW